MLISNTNYQCIYSTQCIPYITTNFRSRKRTLEFKNTYFHICFLIQTSFLLGIVVFTENFKNDSNKNVNEYEHSYKSDSYDLVLTM